MLLKANLDGCSALPELAVIPCCLCKRAPIHPDHREDRRQGWEKRERQQFSVWRKKLKHPERVVVGHGEGRMFRVLETTNLQVFFRARKVGLGESLGRGLGDPP